MENTFKKGGISVQTEHIFPVIKKWLYSEKDIFLREIVSNASDAVTKLKRLASLGQYDDGGETYRIDVILDKAAKTLTVSDNGIGMTAEELDRYICQIALSGALEFVEKYEGENKNNGIIGHFGLGFYSSFMVSDTVELITKSYTDAPAVHWTCNTDGNYETAEGERESHGTTVIMHISDEENAYLEKYKIEEILDKYCAFMPVEIYFTAEGDEEEKKEDTKDEKEPEPPKPINDTTPLWLKNPSDCTPEEYKEFYRKVFHDWREPLFWIHVNADYPLNFRGILYFPKITNEYESIEGQVKLYYNQVFVADNIKEVIPEYLLMLKGVLDCPELPLNVSRSYLQNNTYVAKVSAHIVKKVADKLNSLCNTAREEYEKVWNDIRTFVEYACMRDRKFYDRVKDSLLIELTDGKFVTTADYLEAAKEKHENIVYYTSDKAAQAQYISMFEAQNIAVAVFEKQLHTQFLSMIESYNSDVKYVRIDADVAGALKSDETAVEDKALSELFVKVSGNEKLKVSFSALKDESVPVLLTISEESRRMEEMMKMYAMSGMNMGMSSFPTEATLTVNTASPLIAKLGTLDDEKQEKTAAYLYELALLSQRKLTAEELQKFLADSYSVLDLI
ncbi:MAG: molecular chaperone HtpG [Clostridia bacterium]|nr:molecular chaperone HtpG [Clostridia bacterium]